MLISEKSVIKKLIIDKALLDVYDESLARYGSYLYILRRDFIKKIADISRNMHVKLTNSLKNLSITYKSQIDIDDDDTIDSIYNKFLDKLTSNRKHDIDIEQLDMVYIKTI